MAIQNLGTMKWLYKNEVPWTNETFDKAAQHGDLETMKWMYEKGCLCGEKTFANAGEYGDLDNMKWLFEKGCPWGMYTTTTCVAWSFLPIKTSSVGCEHMDVLNIKQVTMSFPLQCPTSFEN